MGMWMALAVLVVSAVSSSQARQALKGDPGELGDVGFDLSHYHPSSEAKSRAKRYFLSFPPSSSLTFNNKIKIPLFSKFNSNISTYPVCVCVCGSIKKNVCHGDRCTISNLIFVDDAVLLTCNKSDQGSLVVKFAEVYQCHSL